MFFKGRDQFCEIVKELFSRLAVYDEVRKSTEKLEVAFKFHIEDLRLEFTLIINKGNILLDFHNECQPKAVLKMSTDIFHHAMSGTLNLPAALINKNLTIDGDTRSILNLAALGKSLSTTYSTVYYEKVPAGNS